MGFLDFLKKEKQQPIEMPPAPSTMAEIPPPMPEPMHVDFAPPVVEPAQIPEPQAPTPPSSEPPKQESLDLPDFTDEEMEAADEAPIIPVAPVKAPVMAPEPLVAPDYIELPVRKVEQPMPLPELPELPSLPQVSMPRIHTAPENVETKYLSSESYLMITGHGKAIRRAIRQNDEAIKNAVIVHEQLDAQYRRIAADTNSVQELLMKIEGSLFEE
jgi:hypothetical protein